MKQKRWSVSMFWNTRSMDMKTKLSTISLTVNLSRQQFRVALKLTSTKADFDLALSSGRKLNDEVKELRQEFINYLTKAETILDRLKEPNKDSFTRMFKAETDLFLSNKTDVHFFYLSKMEDLLKDGKIGTRKWIMQCRYCLVKYAPKLYFEEIDEKWLKDYQSYLKQQRNNSDSTCSMKLRCLKIIMNIAKAQGFISESYNPFKNIKLAASGTSKAVLYPPQLKQLFNYQTKGVREGRAKAFFFFCYLGNGMNFKDMTLLKYKDLKGDSFTFIREKTKERMKNGKVINVHLHDEMKKIIAEWGNPSKAPDDYVFPVLVKGSSLLKQEADKWRYKRVANEMLSKIGKKLGFDVHLCLNLARHSFATTLKLSGTPVAFIGDALGHTNSKTTEHYMKTLPDENVRQMSAQLLKFG